MSERQGQLERINFDLWVSRSEQAAIDQARESSEAFAIALQRQVRRGRETAKRGTFVDPSPPIGALRIRGQVPVSACGSPAAMCAASASVSMVAAALK